MLEQRVGVRLYDKIENRYYLNTDGRRILGRVKRLRDDIANIGTILDLGEPNDREKLPVAATSFVTEMLFPIILNKLIDLDISLCIHEVIGQDISPIFDDTYPLAMSQYRIGRSNWKPKVLGSLRIGFYCSMEYVKRTVIPVSSRLLRSHRFAVWSDLLRSTTSASSDTLKNVSSSTLLESDGLHLVLQAALDGKAIAAIPQCIARRHSDLLRVLDDTSLDSLTLWSHTNQKLEQNAAVQMLLNAMSTALAELEADTTLPQMSDTK